MDKEEIRKRIPEGTFDRILAGFEAHDESCASLRWLWFGHKGGVTGFNDTYYCDGCDQSFWVDDTERVYIETPPDAEADEDWCDCCARKRGLK